LVHAEHYWRREELKVTFGGGLELALIVEAVSFRVASSSRAVPRRDTKGGVRRAKPTFEISTSQLCYAYADRTSEQAAITGNMK